MTKKLIYSSLLVVALFISGCSEDDTDTGGEDTLSERTETNQENAGGVTSTPTGIEQTSQTEETNQAPSVNAGADMTVIVNETVTITGSASDSDGTISSIEWKKGSEVLATTLSFSYTPTVVRTDVLKLTVMDDDGESSSDSVNITVEEQSNFETK